MLRLVAATLTLLLVACDGGNGGKPTAERSPSRLSERAFLAQMDDLCDELGVQFEEFDDVRSRRGAAVVLERVAGAVAEFAQDVGAVWPPSQYEQAFDLFVEQAQQGEKLFQKMANLPKRASARRLLALRVTAAEQSERLFVLAGAAGLPRSCEFEADEESLDFEKFAARVEVACFDSGKDLAALAKEGEPQGIEEAHAALDRLIKVTGRFAAKLEDAGTVDDPRAKKMVVLYSSAPTLLREVKDALSAGNLPAFDAAFARYEQAMLAADGIARSYGLRACGGTKR